MMDDLIDWFGKDFSIMSRNGDEIVVRIKCNEDSFFYWALHYSMHVEVLSPDTLRERLRKVAEEMVKKYQGDASSR